MPQGLPSPQPDRTEYLRQLTSAFEHSREKDRFDSSLFFREWYDQPDRAFFFLFAKNLTTTNLQFAELTSLLRTYITDTTTSQKKAQLLFLSSRSLKDTVQDLVTERGILEKLDYRRSRHLATLYGELLGRIVVFDVLFGSAAIFLPLNLQLDLARICALSGYIHSCGRTVFLRSTEKVTQDYIADALERSLARHPPQKRAFLAAYAHEDFTEFDRAVAARLRHGLDDVKIYVDKFYVAGERLPRVLINLRRMFNDRLIIPPPGDYHRAHFLFRAQSEVDEDRTYWLIVDNGVSETGDKAPQRYLICYDQLYSNACPFQIFDENKPAWVAHTTIPHSLMRAMLNISLPWKEGPVSIADPFVGTGTTWFEALKFSDAEVVCSDVDPITPLLVRDNRDFFLSCPEELTRMAEELEEISRILLKRSHSEFGDNLELFPQLLNGLGREDYFWTLRMLEKLFPEDAIGETRRQFDASIMEELESKPLSYRILFYIGLRAELRYAGAFTRESLDRETAFALEARDLSRQIRELAVWRSQMEGTHSEAGRFRLFQDSYSRGIGVSPLFLGSVTPSITVRDCRELEVDSYDLIVADPPYGFNTEDEEEKLSLLYHDLIHVFVGALRDNGQLVICLPDRSHTGRKLPACSRKEVVIHQVLVAADYLEKEIVHRARALPEPGVIFRPPFYWEAEKALRRSILHFRLRKRAA